MEGGAIPVNTLSILTNSPLLTRPGCHHGAVNAKWRQNSTNAFQKTFPKGGSLEQSTRLALL
jgi:hypothetical protein